MHKVYPLHRPALLTHKRWLRKGCKHALALQDTQQKPTAQCARHICRPRRWGCTCSLGYASLPGPSDQHHACTNLHRPCRSTRWVGRHPWAIQFAMCGSQQWQGRRLEQAQKRGRGVDASEAAGPAGAGGAGADMVVMLGCSCLQTKPKGKHMG